MDSDLPSVVVTKFTKCTAIPTSRQEEKFGFKLFKQQDSDK